MAFVAASLHCVPAEVPTTPALRASSGPRSPSTRRKDTAASRPLLAIAPLGATLHVLVQVATPDDLQETTVRVLLPGGLEPIDRNLDAYEFGRIHAHMRRALRSLIQCECMLPCVAVRLATLI